MCWVAPCHQLEIEVRTVHFVALDPLRKLVELVLASASASARMVVSVIHRTLDRK